MATGQFERWPPGLSKHRARCSNQNVKVQLQKACYVGRLYAQRRYALSRANTYVHLHHYSLFPDFCLCLLNIDGSSYNRFTRRTYMHIWRRSSHRAFETEDISAAHQLISDTMNIFSYNLMRRRLINYNRQKHQAPLPENVVTSTRGVFIKYRRP